VTIERPFSRSRPDWSDRAAVAEFAAGGAEILGDDPAAARTTAERIWDRTPAAEPAVQMANQLGIVFANLNCKPRWRERLPELTIPALVVHGRRDPFFPVGNAEALPREIPGARLLVLEQTARAIPDAAPGRGRDGDARALPQSGLPPTGDVLRRKHQEQHADPAAATRMNAAALYAGSPRPTIATKATSAENRVSTPASPQVR